MKVVIRISGDVNLKKQIRETLERLRLKRKYSCIVGNFSKEQLGMIKKVRDFVAFGDINNETLEKLIENRAQLIDKTKKINAKKMAEGLRENKDYEKIGIKPFFRLPPPRGGIESKKHFGKGKGVLGDNKEKINELVMRMI